MPWVADSTHRYSSGELGLVDATSIDEGAQHWGADVTRSHGIDPDARGRDGMMGGINIEATVKLAQAVKIPIIASGGLHNIGDVEALCAVQEEGIEGVICGRSIYEGTINLAEAQARADALTEGDEA